MEAKTSANEYTFNPPKNPLTPEQIAIIKSWIRYLRANPEMQGRNRLTTVRKDGTERHCCLGVLCKIAVDAGVVERSDILSSPHPTYGGSTSSLPSEVVEWSGVPSYVGLIGPNWLEDRGAHKEVGLSMLNDGFMGHPPKTFAEIADEISGWLHENT